MPNFYSRGTREESRYRASVSLELSPHPHQDSFFRVLITQPGMGIVEEHTIPAYSPSEIFHTQEHEPLLLSAQDRQVYLAKLEDEPLPDPNAPQSIEEAVTELLRELESIDDVFKSGRMNGD